jgi:predicted DNA-binding transcriptional regulator YafY
MFGNKDEKRKRLAKLQQILSEREAGASELARELGVSRSTILDDVDALDRQGARVCEHNGRFSLLRRWFGKS